MTRSTSGVGSRYADPAVVVGLLVALLMLALGVPAIIRKLDFEECRRAAGQDNADICEELVYPDATRQQQVRDENWRWRVMERIRKDRDER